MTTTSPDVTEYLFSKLVFEPTEKQKPILDCRKRFVLVAGGEQAGKSMVASKYLVSRFLENEEPGLYWLVAADYERTRAEFEYLTQDFATLGVLDEVTKRVDPGRIVLADGTRIETKSAKDPRTLAMRAPNGIIGCEASQLDLESFHRMRGRCAPKRGWLFLALVERLRVRLDGIRSCSSSGSMVENRSSPSHFQVIQTSIYIREAEMILK